jgi:hypothetical protein
MIVYSTIIPITSLLFKSSFDSFRLSNISCHSGGIFCVSKVPSLRFIWIVCYFFHESTSDSCFFCYSSSLEPKKFLILPKNVFFSSFFLNSSNYFCLISSYYSFGGQFENIFIFIIYAYWLFRNKKAILPLG